MPDSSTHLTQILNAVASGDAEARQQVFPLVYEELRRLATARMQDERPSHTLQPTALVNEAYIRLLGDDEQPNWENRRHFFGAAAEAMRRILVDHARSSGRLKRGGDRQRVKMDNAAAPVTGDSPDLVILHESLRRMEEEDPRMAEVVKLRFFAGLSIEHTARAMGVSAMTVKREWAYARAWLHRRIAGEKDSGRTEDEHESE